MKIISPISSQSLIRVGENRSLLIKIKLEGVCVGGGGGAGGRDLKILECFYGPWLVKMVRNVMDKASKPYTDACQ